LRAKRITFNIGGVIWIIGGVEKNWRCEMEVVNNDWTSLNNELALAGNTVNKWLKLKEYLGYI